MAVTKSTTLGQAIFPFLDLAAELRTIIYGLVLGNHTIHIDYPDGDTNLIKADAKAEAFHSLGLVTLCTKKQDEPISAKRRMRMKIE